MHLFSILVVSWQSLEFLDLQIHYGNLCLYLRVHSPLSVSLCVEISPFYEDISPIGLKSTKMTSLQNNYLWKGTSSEVFSISFLGGLIQPTQVVCAIMHAGCSLGVRFWRLLVEFMSGISSLVLVGLFGEPLVKWSGNIHDRKTIYQLVGKHFHILLSFPANDHPCVETDCLCNIL